MNFSLINRESIEKWLADKETKSTQHDEQEYRRELVERTPSKCMPVDQYVQKTTRRRWRPWS